MFSKIIVASGANTSGGLLRQAALLSASEGQVDLFHAPAAGHRSSLDDVLARVARDQADLLVVGARSHLLARRAAMLAPCSVLMVPDGAVLTLDRILTPVDFSETSAAAIRETARIAAHAGSAATVVAIESEEDPWLDWRDYPERHQQALNEFVDRVAGPGHGFHCLVEPEHSFVPNEQGGGGLDSFEGARIAASILDTSKRLGSTLIVAGTRGRTQAAVIFLGSVVEKILQHSAVPVLAVKRPGEQLGLLEGLIERLREHRPLVAS